MSGKQHSVNKEGGVVSRESSFCRLFWKELFEMEISPKISVIIPIYNVEPYLQQCLDSIVNQSYRNLEIILVDDGSTDNCGRICDIYEAQDDRITVIHKLNGGVSSARNAGLGMAKGEWIYFIDADDWIDPLTIETCINKAMDTNVDLVMFEIERFNDEKRFTPLVKICSGRNNDTVHYSLNDTNSLMQYITWGSMCVCIVKANLIKGKLLFNEKIKVAEDTEFKLRLYRSIRSYMYIPRMFYHYRVTQDSASTNKDVMGLFHSRAAAHVVITETIHTEQYPAYVQKMEDGRALGAFINVLAVNLFSNTGLRYEQKKELIYSIITAEVFKSVSENYDRRYLSISAKVFLALKSWPVLAVYLIHFLKDALDAIRTMHDKMERRISNEKTNDLQSK